MENWGKSADGLAAKLKQLKSNLESQKSVLSSYEGQLKKQNQAYEENGKRADNLRDKLKELEAAGKKSSDEYKGYRLILTEVTNEQNKNAKSR